MAFKCSKKKREYSREYYHTHKKVMNANSLRWRTNNPKRVKELQRKADMKHDWGLTPEEYDAKFFGFLCVQDNKCPLCGLDYGKSNKKFVLDHNHKTGKLRGVLCWDCNIGMGKLKDSSKICLNASNYLMKGGVS